MGQALTLPPLYDDWSRGQFRNWLLGAASTIARSTEYVDLIDQAMQTKERQAAAGEAVAQRRHEEMRDKIIRAAGPLPIDRNWPGRVQTRIARNLTFYEFWTVPDRRTIRRARDYLLKNKGT